ncbi:MAG: thioredoxin [Halobacteriales archaeon]
MSGSDDIDAIKEQRLQELMNQTGGQEPAGSAAGDQSAGSPSEPVHVNSKAELDELAANNQVVVADFYADWCGPCKMLEPTVKEIAQNTQAAVAKVDVDALPGLAQQMQVQGVPTVYLFADGEPVKRMVGVQDYSTLESLVQQYGS